MKNLKRKSVLFGLLATFILSVTSCEQELINDGEYISNTSIETSVEDLSTISLYIVETGEFIEVESIEEINFLLESKYSYLDEAEQAVEKLTKFEQELEYSKSLDLGNRKKITVQKMLSMQYES